MIERQVYFVNMFFIYPIRMASDTFDSDKANNFLSNLHHF